MELVSSNISLGPSLRCESDLGELVPTGSLRSPEQVYVALQDSGNFTGRPDGELDTRACFGTSTCRHPRRLLSQLPRQRRPSIQSSDPGTSVPRAGPCYDRGSLLVLEKGVQDYTKRKITRGRDRLIALQGIIFQPGTALRDECVLGIWSNNAARCLAWFVDEDDISEEASRTKRTVDKTMVQAPSWSWTSVRYPIQYRLYHHFAKNLERKTEHFSEMIFVLEISMRPKKKDRFESFEGKLRLQGAVVKGVLFESRIYILIQSPSAPYFEEISQKIRDHQGLTFEKLRQNSSSGAADAHFFDARFLADNVAPSSREAVTPRPSASLDRHTITHNLYEADNPSMVEGRATSRPEEVACLLLFEGGYGNMLSSCPPVNLETRALSST